MANVQRRPELIAYLNRYYKAMPGFSSHLSALIGSQLLLWQSENGISGDAAEIGVFLGRSAIALALALQPTDLFLAIDKFTWPDNALVRFQNYARRYGVAERALVCKAIDTTALSSESFLRETGIGKLRYFHIDGDHSPAVLRHDLSLAVTSMVDRGVICLDDMLHPLYPELQVVVNGFLRDHDELRVCCIIDREDAVAAAKYLLCRTECVESYKTALAALFPQYVFPGHGDFSGSQALILSLDTAVIPYYDTLNRTIDS